MHQVKSILSRGTVSRRFSSSKTVIPKSPSSTASNLQQEVPPNPVPLRSRNNKGLQEPLPGLSPPNYVEIDHKKSVYYETQLSTLENGMRVASQPRFGKYATVGVAIATGSRHERGYPYGISHFLEKLGFSPSRNFESRQKIIKTLEQYGGLCDSQTSRDTTVYGISAERDGLEEMLKLIADTVLYPTLTKDMLEEVGQSIIFEQEDMELRPEQDLALTEMIHSVAFKKETLGIPRYCPLQNVKTIKRGDLLQFLKTYYVPSRIVVSGVGVDHNELVDMSRRFFDFSKATWNIEEYDGKQTEPSPDYSNASYSGGMLRVEKDFGSFNSGPLPVPSLAHLAFALESVPHSHPDFITTCVLNILMGGGGSFSAGGPGKGMYSRLYRNVLNQYSWANSATAYNSSYSDSGIFTVYGSAPPNYLKSLVTVIMKQLAGMAGPVTDQELLRSKTQLQSMLLMNLESRAIVFEDIGRQVLSNGSYKSPEDYIKDIDKVRAEDIERVSKRLLESRPSVAALGNLYQMPSYEEVSGNLTQYYKNVLDQKNGGGKFKLFRP